MFTDKHILLLLSFTISCNGFFWQTNQAPQAQQQTVQPQNDYSYKQVPLSYFRTYTYQPLTYPPAPSFTPVQAYPVTSRLYQNNMPTNNNWQRQSQPLPSNIPQALGMQPQPMQPQQQPMPAPQQQQMQQPQLPQQQQQQSQPQQQPEFVPQQMMPQPQPIKPSPPQVMSPMYGGNPADASYNYQYLPTVNPMNVQHVQFVPCMCPVTVTVSTSPEIIAADKRTDELVTSESNESIQIVSVDEKNNNNLNNL